MYRRDSRSRHRGQIILIFVLAACVAGVVIAFRMHAAWALRHDAETDGDVQVSVISPKRTPAVEELILPGNVEAWHQATLYARANGYVKRWETAFGNHVHKGDVLAELETPELDAQLRQAEADAKTAQANNTLAQITAKRWKDLLKTDSVSKQETDEKVGDAAAKEAALASAIANRDHLRDLTSFKTIRAPFDGIVSSRLLDVGMLVTAGTDTQQPLFTMVQSNRLRIYVKVPENYSTRINASVEAELHFTEHPGEIFTAKFYKSANAIDPASRTLLTEFVAENKDEKLFAGGYTEAHIKLPGSETSLKLPVNAMIFRAAGLQVATLDESDTVVLKKVVMGRDYGNEVEISSGLSPEDRVVINPPDSLAKGQHVHVIVPKKEENKKDDGKKDADKKNDGKKDEKK